MQNNTQGHGTCIPSWTLGKKSKCGCSYGLLWLWKFEKEMSKALERKGGIYQHLFMKIMQNRRKWMWKVKGCMWGGKGRKIMENEENIGHINQNAFEDQLVTFFKFSVEAFILLYISILHTLG